MGERPPASSDPRNGKPGPPPRPRAEPSGAGRGEPAGPRNRLDEEIDRALIDSDPGQRIPRNQLDPAAKQRTAAPQGHTRSGTADRASRVSGFIPTGRKLDVRHHVYTSEGGYRTVYASPGLGPMVAKLETWARQRCSERADTARWASVALTPAIWLISKTFVSGVDHSGRPRTCVHTIVFGSAQLCNDWPYFNPMRLPGRWFLTAKSAVNKKSLATALPDAVDIPAAGGHQGPADSTASADGVAFVQVDAALLSTLMYASHGVVVAGADPGSTHPIAIALDRLPLRYRLAWAISTDPLPTQTAARQILLRADVPRDFKVAVLGVAQTDTAFASRFTPASPPGGLHRLLASPGLVDSALVGDLKRWVDALDLPSLPEGAREDWLVAAFQCLGGTDARAIESADQIPQLALGLLCIGWAGFADTATRYADQVIARLTARDQWGPLALLAERLSRATAPPRPPHARPAETVAPTSASTRNVHASVAQALWSFLTSDPPVRLGGSHMIPVDLGASAAPWHGSRRSRLWATLAHLIRPALLGATRGTTSPDTRTMIWLAKTSERLVLHADLVERGDNDAIAELTGPKGTAALLARAIQVAAQRLQAAAPATADGAVQARALAASHQRLTRALAH